MLNNSAGNYSSISDKRKVLFSGTALNDYMTSKSRDPYYCTENFDSAVAAFVRECNLSFQISSERFNPTKRYESIRTFIVKLLLSIGLLPHDNAFAVIAKLIQTLCVDPYLRLNELIDNFAKAHGATSDSVMRIVEKCIDVYDEDQIMRITRFTQSRPMTVKDVVCDLAVYVRAKYFDGRGYNERHIG
ncbi:MAG: hypothetical protein K2L54_04985 [Clostridiales bacterium]|nr:hypothetical protein [Clostridiales bacterium]